jgi:hypothetical protein
MTGADALIEAARMIDRVLERAIPTGRLVPAGSCPPGWCRSCG